MSNKILLDLFKKGSQFLETKYPIMGGAMTWLSERNLVSAVSNAGGFGVIAAGSMSKFELEVEIDETRKRTSKPFGVNLILLHPDIDDLIDSCVFKKVNAVVFAGGFPKKSQILKLKSAGIKTLCFATSIHSFRLTVVLLSSSIIPSLTVFSGKLNIFSISENKSHVN